MSRAYDKSQCLPLVSEYSTSNIENAHTIQLFHIKVKKHKIYVYKYGAYILNTYINMHIADILISYFVKIVVKLKMVGLLLLFILKVTVIISIIKEKIRRAKHNYLIKFLQKLRFSEAKRQMLRSHFQVQDMKNKQSSEK